MSPARRVVEEYTALLARAFNGAIEVDGTRIVAHPSGTLLARTPRPILPASMGTDANLHDDDWSSV